MRVGLNESGSLDVQELIYDFDSRMPMETPFIDRNRYRILQSCTSRSWGGLEMQALIESTELRDRGHDLTLLCSPKSRLEEEAKRVDLRTLPLELGTAAYPLALGNLRRFLIRNEVEVVQAQLSQDLKILVPAATFISNPPAIILTKRVGSFITKKDPFHRWLYRHVSLVIAISEVIRKNVLDTCPIDPERVVKLFDGVDLKRFDRRRIDRMAVRREFGLSDRELVVGLVGRFSPGKGHEEFIQAAKVIHSRFPEIKFLVVGEPSFGEEVFGENIQELAQPLRNKRVMTFTGYRADIPEVMAGLDILAFPSHAEAFGDVLIEAMAMGLPVVSTNCDGVVEIVVNGETGIQVPPKDASALAEALMKLIQDEPLRKLFGHAGRRRAERVFNLEARTDRVEELYADLLGLSSRNETGYSIPQQLETR